MSAEFQVKLDRKLATEIITPELIDYVTKKIVTAIQPEKLILFGSYARGDFKSTSDLDLLIIKDGNEPNRVLRRKIEALLRGRKFSVDLLVRKSSEVAWNIRAENPFYLDHILKDGKVLYEKA